VREHSWNNTLVAYIPSVGCVCLSVRKVYCGKTVDWIRVPFGVVSGVGRVMGVLDRGGDRRRERTVWRPTETNGDFVE